MSDGGPERRGPKIGIGEVERARAQKWSPNLPKRDRQNESGPLTRSANWASSSRSIETSDGLRLNAAESVKTPARARAIRLEVPNRKFESFQEAQSIPHCRTVSTTAVGRLAAASGERNASRTSSETSGKTGLGLNRVEVPRCPASGPPLYRNRLTARQNAVLGIVSRILNGTHGISRSVNTWRLMFVFDCENAAFDSYCSTIRLTFASQTALRIGMDVPECATSLLLDRTHEPCDGLARQRSRWVAAIKVSF